MSGKFYIVGTPIGNLGEMTFRAVEILKSVDQILCEDSRRTLKLLNHFEIKKPLQAVPYFRERSAVEKLLNQVRDGHSVAYVSDAGMPGVSDPGAILVAEIRKAGLPIEVIGGVSALTSFIAGCGKELSEFRFVGFLPPKTGQREKAFAGWKGDSILFFESPHRMEGTLELLAEKFPDTRLVLAKELSKVSEGFFEGSPAELLKSIRSWKGEWVGLWLSEPTARKDGTEPEARNKETA